MGFMTLLIGVLLIATTSIGIKCENECKKSGSNKNFLIFMLVMGILAVIFQIGMYVVQARTRGVVSA
jgi:hypothetical protein